MPKNKQEMMCLLPIQKILISTVFSAVLPLTGLPFRIKSELLSIFEYLITKFYAEHK